MRVASQRAGDWRAALPMLALVGTCLAALPAAAQNLLPNGSFEGGGCPYSFKCGSLPPGWVCATQGTADWYKGAPCSSSGNFGVPSNIAGHQPARTGVGYGHVIGVSPNGSATGTPYSEYLRTSLPSPLDPGQLYCAEMWAVVADEIYTGVKAGFLGVLLTEDAPPSGSVAPLYTAVHGFSPQATNAGAITSADTWHPVAGTFTATGLESYVTVGVFPASSADLGGVTPGASNKTFLEDVAISPSPPNPAFSLDSVVFEGDDIGFDAAITTGETAWFVRVCRVGEDCGQPEYGHMELHFGEEVGNFLLNERVSAPFELEGSPAGVSYDVTLGAYDACSGWTDTTLTLTVFTPPGEECTELLTFDGLPTGSGEVPVSTPWVEGSYTFDADFGSLQTFAPDATEWSGSKALHAPSVAAGALGLTMRRTDGEAFSVCKAEMTEGGFVPPVQEDFRGYDDVARTNQVVSKLHTLDGNAWVPETVPLDEFQSIRLLETLGYTDDQWDDVCICEAPELCWAAPALVGLWPGDDCSGWGYFARHGSFVGGSVCGPVAKVGDGAHGFNGSNRLQVPHLNVFDFGPDDFSIAAWVRIDSGTTGVILQKLSSEGYRLDVVSGGLPRFTVCDGSQCVAATASDAIDDGSWHHVAATRAVTQSVVYVDGAVSGYLSHLVGDTSNPAATEIGTGLAGLLDDVALFATTLTQDEVRELFLAGVAGLCDPSQYVRFGGTPVSGRVTVGLFGVDVTTPIQLGESAADLVARLVALIAAEPLLDEITATADGDTLVLTGSGRLPVYVHTDDPGLVVTGSFEREEVPSDVAGSVALPILGAGLLAVLLLALGGWWADARPTLRKS